MKSADFEPDVERFLAARTRRDFGARIRSTELRALYLNWARDHDAQALTATSFGSILRRLGYRSMKASIVIWLDVAPVDLPENGRMREDQVSGVVV